MLDYKEYMGTKKQTAPPKYMKKENITNRSNILFMYLSLKYA